MNIYVGNLSYTVTEAELRAAFEAHGAISSVSLVKDKYSGESKGFGFVEMPTQSEAEEAIKRLNGSSLKGRMLTANVARPRENKSTDRSSRRY